MKPNLVLRILSYVFDWAIILVAVFAFQKLGKIAGHQQLFSLVDPTLKYEYTGGSTIPNSALVLLSVVFPAVAIAALTILLDTPDGRHGNRLYTLLGLVNRSWLGLALSICLSQVFTNTLKVTIGRPRPDLLARCIPSASAVVNTLNAANICTQTDMALLHDGFRSFPSGHSSMAFSGLAYLTLFFAWRLSLFNKRGETWKWVIVVCPMMVASLIAITRIMDNRHHPFDVLFGSALGTATSLVAFFQYHPQLDDATKRYPPRFSEEVSTSQFNAGENLTTSNTEHGEA